MSPSAGRAEDFACAPDRVGALEDRQGWPPPSLPAAALPLFAGFEVVGLDIETNGLDPEINCILAIAFVARSWHVCFLGDDEKLILEQADAFVQRQLVNTLLVTWNGEEFDLPFIKERCDRLRVSTTLRMTPTHERGKYGGTLFRGAWADSTHVDVAPMFQSLALSLHVRWSLKPVAKKVLGIQPVEVDRSGEAIAGLDEDELSRYVVSDARITRLLAEKLIQK